MPGWLGCAVDASRPRGLLFMGYHLFIRTCLTLGFFFEKSNIAQKMYYIHS